jgi:SAM-dependent methyltransferase
MIEVARAAAADDRLRFVAGTAERLPWPATTFDLVVSTTSFDHWVDQPAGLAECSQVLAAAWSWPTCSRRCCCRPCWPDGGARHEPDGVQPHLLTAAGLHSLQWHRLYAVIIQAVTATK